MSGLKTEMRSLKSEPSWAINDSSALRYSMLSFDCSRKHLQGQVCKLWGTKEHSKSSQKIPSNTSILACATSLHSLLNAGK